MKIGIVGAGVLGSIFSCLFSRAGLDVTLIEIVPERIALIRSEGLKITMPDGEVLVTRPNITSEPSRVGVCDVVAICVKGYHTASAIESALPMIGEKTTVMSVQNGLGNLELIAERVGARKVVGGITAHSGMGVGLNEVRYVGGLGALLTVGPFAGEAPETFRLLVDKLLGAGLDVALVEDINSVMWKKLIANVSTNCIAAVTGLTGGQAVQHPPTVAIIRQLCDELAAVARAKGIDFPELDAPGDFALKCFAGTRDNKVSMLQDVEAGRPTEIGSLNEVIVNEGRRFGIPTPANEMMVMLVRGIEERNRVAASIAAA